jgi:heterodisulfide reductase subunit C/nitrate reductase gamma subunit
MFFKISFYLSLILFGIGMGYKIVNWFRCRVGDQARDVTGFQRVSAALQGGCQTFFSSQLVTLIKVFLIDVLLQGRLFRESRLRWAAHICLSYGILLLLLMHALDTYVTKKLFVEYASTLNPFMFLRNLFGAMVIAGLAVAVYRRLTDRVMRLTTGGPDVYALVILSVIILSGFFLEATKIVSHQRYQEMVSEFSSITNEEETQALKAYWAQEFAVVFPQPSQKPDPASLEKGKELHVLNCASCHSKPTSAFLSYGVAKAVSPFGLEISQGSVRNFLYYVHFLSCFLGLALLPFTKMFHILTSPLILLINGVMDWTKASPANVATVRAIEIDACTHCATCSLHCSVGPVYQAIPNRSILPSEKLRVLTPLANEKEKMTSSLAGIEEGEYICTKCTRCTTVCPVGINLQDLWFNLDKTLSDRECPDLFTRIQDAFVGRFDWNRKKAVIQLPPSGKKFTQEVGLTFQASTFNNCFTCMTCSNACPIVTNYQYPLEKLGLLPHLIMQNLRYGLQNNVLGARMVWDCLGCYNCQECCPQGVRVTDILFELKNLAFQQGKSPCSGEGNLGGKS